MGERASKKPPPPPPPFPNPNALTRWFCWQHCWESSIRRLKSDDHQTAARQNVPGYLVPTVTPQGGLSITSAFCNFNESLRTVVTRSNSHGREVQANDVTHRGGYLPATRDITSGKISGRSWSCEIDKKVLARQRQVLEWCLFCATCTSTNLDQWRKVWRGFQRHTTRFCCVQSTGNGKGEREVV